MLELINIDKSYGQNHALDHFTAALDNGICALLGPNGSGKSTLMNIITGNLKADGGKIVLDGHDKKELGREYYRSIGFMPQYTGMYPQFTVSEMLFYMAELKGIPKKKATSEICEFLEIVELTQVAGRKIKSLSGGMRQRLALVQALLGEPKVVLLDEPTAGLDPKQRIIVRNLIAEQALCRTVIIATHIVSDIEATASSAIFLNKGVIHSHDTPVALAREMDGKVFTCSCSESELPDLQRRYSVLNLVKEESGELCVRLLSDGQDAGLTPVVPTLEDAYLSVFGVGGRSDAEK